MSTLLSLAFFLLAAHLFNAAWNYWREYGEVTFSAVFNYVCGVVAVLAGLSLL